MKAATVAAWPAPYGCHNRPALGEPRTVQNGWDVLQQGGVQFVAPTLVRIPHRMSTECQHPSAADPRCEGCRWRRSA